MVENGLISAGESIVSQGIEKGFDNIDYGAAAQDAVVGAVSARGNGLSKGQAKHLMKQGVDATKNIIKKGFSKSSKYYFSQTMNMFYKPTLKKAAKDLIIDPLKNTAEHYLGNLYRRYCNA